MTLRGFSRGLILFFGALLSNASVGADAAPEDASRRPNILLFITDDQSWLHTGVVGCEAVQTPAFDRVARDGVYFRNAFSPSSSCTPARSAILTGQSIWRLAEGGQFGRTLPRRFEVFPFLLRAAGYSIGWTGKGWGPGDLRAGGWTEPPLGAPFNDRTVKPYRMERRYMSFDYAANFTEFLRTRDTDAPFFFWCGTVQPHRPYEKGAGLEAGKSPEQVFVPPHLPDEPEVRSDLLDYCLEIDYLDGQLGRILTVLRERDLRDDTLVIVTSDNGPALPRAKSSLYDLGTRVPLAIAWPSEFPEGRTVDDLVELTDLAPTLLELAGIEVPATMTGRSLAASLASSASGRIDPARDHVVTAIENSYPMRALRTPGFLLIKNLEPELSPEPGGYFMRFRGRPDYRAYQRLACSKRPQVELFDLEQDPWQLRNVAADPAYAERARVLLERLEEHLSDTGDPRARGENPFGKMPAQGETDPMRWRESMFGTVRADGVLQRTTPGPASEGSDR